MRFRKKTILDEAIEDAKLHMRAQEMGSKEYNEAVANVVRLEALKKETQRGAVSPDTLAIVLGNLAGILIIVSYERMHVMASRGLNFILRTKLQ